MQICCQIAVWCLPSEAQAKLNEKVFKPPTTTHFRRFIECFLQYLDGARVFVDKHGLRSMLRTPSKSIDRVKDGELKWPSPYYWFHACRDEADIKRPRRWGQCGASSLWPSDSRLRRVLEGMLAENADRSGEEVWQVIWNCCAGEPGNMTDAYQLSMTQPDVKWFSVRLGGIRPLKMRPEVSYSCYNELLERTQKPVTKERPCLFRINDRPVQTIEELFRSMEHSWQTGEIVSGDKLEGIDVGTVLLSWVNGNITTDSTAPSGRGLRSIADRAILLSHNEAISSCIRIIESNRMESVVDAFTQMLGTKSVEKYATLSEIVNHLNGSRKGFLTDYYLREFRGAEVRELISEIFPGVEKNGKFKLSLIPF